MRIKNTKRTVLISLIILLNVGLDQISKYAVRINISENETIYLISDILMLKKVENAGAAMGIGSNMPSMIKTIYFQLLPMLFLMYLYRMLIKNTGFSKLLVTGIALAIGGGFGNIVDRIAFGHVTDFVRIKIGFLKSGIFNIADVSIVIGIILVFSEILLNRNKTTDKRT